MTSLPLTSRFILSTEGPIARRMPAYESRQQQTEMAEAVEAAIASRQHLVVEAGTGTGKTFAYLVPAILAATGQTTAAVGPTRSATAHNASTSGTSSSASSGSSGPTGRRRVIISTHTISLQEQLIDRDLPLLNAVLPVEFSAVLVKGRSNYVSLRRLNQAVQRAPTLLARAEDADQLSKVSRWARQTTDGSLSDLEFRPAPQLWEEVQSEHGNCLGKTCPTYDDCLYYKARRRAWNADVLVVNHALFFSDLSLRRQGASVLPDYDLVILDEAHTIEQVAADHLGLSISSSQIEYLLNRLYHERLGKGLLARPTGVSLQQEHELVARARERARELFADLTTWCTARGPANGRLRKPPGVDNALSPALMLVSEAVQQLASAIPSEEERIEYTAAAERCQGLAQSVQSWLSQSQDGAVYWRETYGPDQTRTRLLAAPVDVGPVLRDELFQKVPSVILTSATLAIGQQDFGFVRQRLGLSTGGDLQLGSPFDYGQQVRLVLPAHMPDPTTQSAAYDAAVCERLPHYIDRTRGRAFVLFTSYRLLQQAVRQLTPWLRSRGYGLYVQGGDLARSAMLDQFRNDPAGVLFGTDSFWQGVDVPGEALSNVIITKLPFSVPDQPLLEARVEQLRQAGRNPFLEYQVPEAIIKLKQGFGRLVRTRTDTGLVVILDPRVRTKPYGRLFLQSLPECPVEIDDASVDGSADSHELLDDLFENG
jgi:ATP-dependent DNA helicase DinG